jgi:hypothetical protein
MTTIIIVGVVCFVAGLCLGIVMGYVSGTGG